MWQAWTLVAALAAPTAIIDSVLGDAPVRELELVRPGERIELPSGTRVRIAYFASCVHETVRGGWLRIGVTASFTEAEAIERVTAECTPPAFSPAGAGAPAAMVLRDRTRDARTPVNRLRTRTPLLVARGDERVMLEREAPYGRTLFISVEDGTFDFAEHGLELGPGEVWRACAGDRCRRVWVDPHAQHARGPVLERVIALP